MTKGQTSQDREGESVEKSEKGMSRKVRKRRRREDSLEKGESEEDAEWIASQEYCTVDSLIRTKYFFNTIHYVN